MAESLLDSALEDVFNEAANVVQLNATGAAKGSVKPTDSQLLELYGLYKVATCGPCDEPQPGMFNLRAKSKWNAWKEKSDLSKPDSMNQYIKKVMLLYAWTPPTEDELGDGDCRHKKVKVPSGFAPAVSRPAAPMEEKKGNTPFDWVKDNEIAKIKEWVSNSPSDINTCDDDGLTLLHWAADRGHKEICELLLAAGADPCRPDADDQTPLDYAVTCDHTDIIELLSSKP